MVQLQQVLDRGQSLEIDPIYSDRFDKGLSEFEPRPTADVVQGEEEEEAGAGGRAHIQLSRKPRANTTNLRDAGLWKLDGTFETMRLSRDPRFDSVDSFSGRQMQGFVADPPEADAMPFVRRRKPAFEERSKKAVGERVAPISGADVRVAGRELHDIGSTRAADSHPLLSTDRRRAPRLLAPVRLQANDVSIHQVLGEATVNADIVRRDAFIDGGLNPKERTKARVFGVDNLPTTAVSFGHVAEGDRLAKFESAQPRIPVLREKKRDWDPQDMVFSQNQPAARSMPSKFKVGRAPMRVTDADIRRTDSFTPTPEYTPKTTRQNTAAPAMRAYGPSAHDHAQANHYHKDRTAPQINTRPMQGEVVAKNVFRVTGEVVVGQKPTMTPFRGLEMDHSPLQTHQTTKGEHRQTTRPDLHWESPQKDNLISGLQAAPRYAVESKDRTRLGSVEAPQSVLELQEFSRHRTADAGRRRVREQQVGLRVDMQDIDVPTPMVRRDVDLPKPRIGVGKERREERSLANPALLHADPTVSGLALDAANAGAAPEYVGLHDAREHKLSGGQYVGIVEPPPLEIERPEVDINRVTPRQQFSPFEVPLVRIDQLAAHHPEGSIVDEKKHQRRQKIHDGDIKASVGPLRFLTTGVSEKYEF